MPRLDAARMPNCEMARVVVHWTAGAYKASALDKEHYHVLIEGDGTVVYGNHAIDANAKPAREPRASHTRNCNTGSIGVSVCCMKDARERPFFAGPFPMTVQQWQAAAEVVAELCARYTIDVTPRTVLAHGEVEATLKIPQLQKWDPMVLPWMPSTPRQQAMDQFRASVRDHLSRLAPGGPTPARAPTPTTTPSPFQPQTQDWPGDSAVLLVHGIGNAAPGDYTDVAQAVRTALGTDCAVYSLFYDVFNDWFREKTQFANQIGRLTAFVKSKQPQNQDQLPDTIAEFAGDVIWPLFSVGARAAVRTAYIAQLRQMVLDGRRSTNKPIRDLKLSIICHSLGCFHTYEVLHAMATDAALNLRPVTDGIRFRSVVFVASPVQLIRTVGEAVNALVPHGLATTLASGLAIPAQTALGTTRKSVERWVSITGDLDPIGGHFVRNKADWAYMNVTEPEAVAIVDRQTLIGTGDERQDLLAVLRASLDSNQPPSIRPNDPHSWLAYLQRHQGELPTWFA